MIIDQQALMANAIEIFIVYSQSDEEDRLLSHFLDNLHPLSKNDSINFSHRKCLLSGTNYKEELKNLFKKAQIVILMLSPNFLDDEDCLLYMKRALDGNIRNQKRVIPIGLRPYNSDINFEEYGLRPKNNKTISMLSKREREVELRDISIMIKAVVEAVRKEKRADYQSLYDLLYGVNYVKQSVNFYNFDATFKRRIGIFLIHGTKKQGQFWLFNRLVKNIEPAMLFRFDFMANSHEHSFTELWKDFAKRLSRLGFEEVSKDADKNKIIKNFHTLWQTKSVFIVLDHVHGLGEQAEADIDDFLRQFWHPLIYMIQQSQARNDNDNYLLMFLLDDEDVIDGWTTPSIKEVDQNPYTPIKFEKLQHFSHKELETLFRNAWEKNIVFNGLTLKTLWKDSLYGTPELVLEDICEECGYERQDFMRFRE